MDVDAFSRRERNLEDAERLIASERARLEGTCGYSVEEFAANMREAVKTGSRKESIY